MGILERQVQKLKKCEWNEYTEFEKKNEAIERRLGGFPTKKHYGFISGREITCMVVWQREWESPEVMWRTYKKFSSDPKPELEGENSPIAYEKRSYYSKD